MLLVEDEPIVRNLAARLLRDLGYTVLEAANGVVALAEAQIFSGEDIHLLLMDVVMPEMGGKELAKQFVTARPKTRVLYTSGYADDAFLNHGALEPDHAFIPKPFSPGSLALKAREVLDS